MFAWFVIVIWLLFCWFMLLAVLPAVLPAMLPAWMIIFPRKTNVLRCGPEYLPLQVGPLAMLPAMLPAKLPTHAYAAGHAAGRAAGHCLWVSGFGGKTWGGQGFEWTWMDKTGWTWMDLDGPELTWMNLNLSENEGPWMDAECVLNQTWMHLDGPEWIWMDWRRWRLCQTAHILRGYGAAGSA
jgi:hypothetical protein